LNIGHFPLPKRVYVAFHHLYVFLLLNHQPAYLQQPFIEVLGFEVSQAMLKLVVFGQFCRIAPSFYIGPQPLNIVIEHMACSSDFPLIIYLGALENR